MAIIGNKSLSDQKKSNRLEALGLSRVQLPELNSLKSTLSTRLGELYKEAGILGPMIEQEMPNQLV